MSEYKQLGFSKADLVLMAELIEEGRLIPRLGQTYAEAFLEWKEEEKRRGSLRGWV